jgi:hypothetical protein
MRFSPNPSQRRTPWHIAYLVLCVLLASLSGDAEDRGAGKSIGKISTLGKLIVLELDENALGKENLSDLEGRTLRLSPVAGGYEVASFPLRWDPEFGSELMEPEVRLHNSL